MNSVVMASSNHRKSVMTVITTMLIVVRTIATFQPAVVMARLTPENSAMMATTLILIAAATIAHYQSVATVLLIRVSSATTATR